MKKIYKIILISFILYVIFFCRIGNTCYRINSEGNKIFNIIPLFTEGIIGPIRTLYLTLIHNGLWDAIKYIRFEAYNFANPFAVFAFVYGISKIIDQNKIFN